MFFFFTLVREVHIHLPPRCPAKDFKGFTSEAFKPPVSPSGPLFFCREQNPKQKASESHTEPQEEEGRPFWLFPPGLAMAFAG